MTGLKQIIKSWLVVSFMLMLLCTVLCGMFLADQRTRELILGESSTEIRLLNSDDGLSVSVGAEIFKM